MKNNLLVFILTVAFLILAPSIAAQEVSLSISPPLYHVVTKQDRKITIPYTVVNYGDPTLIKITPYRLTISDSKGGYRLAPYQPDAPLSPKLILEETVQEPFLILSKQAYDGEVTLIIPDHTPQEDFSYSIVAETQNSKGFETSSAIIINGGVGMNLIVSVSNSGNTEKDVSITQFSIRPLYTLRLNQKKVHLIDSGKAIHANLTLVNKGKHATKLTGTVHLASAYSWLPFNEYSDEISHTFILAHEQQELELKEIPAQYGGMFTLNAALDVEGSHVVYEKTSFIVFPFTLVGIVIIILLLLTFIVFLYKRYTKA